MNKPPLPKTFKVISTADRDAALQLTDKDLIYLDKIKDFIFLSEPKKGQVAIIIDYQSAYYCIWDDQVFIFDYQNAN